MRDKEIPKATLQDKHVYHFCLTQDLLAWLNNKVFGDGDFKNY